MHMYVALSRSRGRDNIRPLRDFDERLLTRHPNEPLREEDIRDEVGCVFDAEGAVYWNGRGDRERCIELIPCSASRVT